MPEPGPASRCQYSGLSLDDGKLQHPLSLSLSLSPLPPPHPGMTWAIISFIIIITFIIIFIIIFHYSCKSCGTINNYHVGKITVSADEIHRREKTGLDWVCLQAKCLGFLQRKV